jgi:hypothetical protein
MADADILRHLIVRSGQSQDDRAAPELGHDQTPVDGRSPADLLRFLTRLAPSIKFYQAHVKDAVGDWDPSGNWKPFFPTFGSNVLDAARQAERLFTAEDGHTTPHLALLLAFLRLYEEPRKAINTFSVRHLEFFLKRVLRFTPRPAVADSAHVLVQLKKQAPAVTLAPEHSLSAGKDGKSVELVFAPVRETVISGAKVASLRSIFLDRTGSGTVRVAPIANSSDGVGGKLVGEEPRWPGFGGPHLSPATIGFAIASPVLQMKEGTRKIQLTLTVSGGHPGAAGASAVANGLEVFLTGEKGWLGPYGIDSAHVSATTLRLDLQVPPEDGAVVNYDALVHGQSYGTTSPVMQVLLKTERSTVGYLDLRGVLVQRARIRVEVSGHTSLNLESDAGALDPKKAFQPFTAEPIPGSRFMIGSTEAFTKKLASVTVRIQWQGAPPSFATHYSNYNTTINDASFTAAASIRDGGSWNRTYRSQMLFENGQPTAERVITFTPEGSSGTRPMSYGHQLVQLYSAGLHWSTGMAAITGMLRPVLWSPLAAPPAPKAGVLTLSLERDFLHSTYRAETIRNALKVPSTGPVILNEPYTPRIQAISLDYVAYSDDVALSSERLEDFASEDIQFFHVGGFGQMREHGFQRARFPFVPGIEVPLVPTHTEAGELLVGLAGLRPESSVSLLFQVAEGSADPALLPQPVTWWALCDNYWKPLGDREVTTDTTNRLLRSGLVRVVIPREATTSNTILPPGLLWLRATVPADVTAVCELVEVAADAIEVRFQDNGNDPARLETPLQALRLAKVRIGPPGIKGVTQPYASFGGAPAESDAALTRRATERLRHKSRCITPWDYERMVLETFPSVHRVKCVSHSKDGMWLAPGHVLLVVIPDLRNRNARDPLRPRVDADTISRITTFVSRHAGMQVQVHVKNPRYQDIQVDFAVRFRPDFEFNFYRSELIGELIRFLSPWAHESGPQLTFGGQMYRSTLLAFVEGRESVDYVKDFRMTSAIPGSPRGPDLSEILPETPDAILVSAREHLVRNVEVSER